MRRLVVVVCIACVSWACGGSPDDGQSPPPGSGDTVRGNERLGWDQQAASPAELAQLRYAIYIDGVRSILADAQCTANAGPAGYPCSARLPTMSAGTHTLQLAAFRLENGVVSESSRSPALVVTVSSSASAMSTPSVPPAQPAPSPDAKSASTLALSPLADGFTEITDLSLVKSRLLMVAERRGILHPIDLEREVRFESLVFEGTAAAGETCATVLTFSVGSGDGSGRIDLRRMDSRSISSAGVPGSGADGADGAAGGGRAVGA